MPRPANTHSGPCPNSSLRPTIRCLECGACKDCTPMCMCEEPPLGSVVAIDWGQARQEVWVSSVANVGNWYSTDCPTSDHPTWADVLRRAEGRALTLLVAAAEDTWQAGFIAGITITSQKVGKAISEAWDTLPEKGFDDDPR